MRSLKCVLALFALAIPAHAAWGHGFSLSLQGNSLVATSSDGPLHGNPHLFVSQLSPLLGDLVSSHGGVGSSLFGSGKSLSFDVHSALWFSNGDGSPAELAAAGISMLIEGDSVGFPGAVSIDRDSTFTPGFAISGNTSHEFFWSLQGGSIPTGVYGLAYQVTGSPLDGDPYEPTPLLVATFMTPNFFPGNDPWAVDSPLMLAQNAIYTAATTPIPEPSSMVLLALGAASLATYTWKRRKAVRG